ncbi:DNA replication complex GINS family protein [Candidatus Woesearchaeota archaeon]|nr:MAG: DNA replication complex GINS family protein [Candidatus Woesearchaeota archaeon]
MEEKGVLITYENLYEILRREKVRAELQKLSDTFFQDVLEYLNNKKAILESQEKKDNIFASSEVEKTRIQIKNIKKIIKDLYEKRETKIIQQAILSSRNNSGYDLSSMLPEEQALFNKLLENLNSFRSEILENLLKCTLPKVKKPKDLKRGSEKEVIKKPNVKVLADMPEFVGPDLNTYGPFKKNDEVLLPEDVASHLVGNKQAEVIK